MNTTDCAREITKIVLKAVFAMEDKHPYETVRIVPSSTAQRMQAERDFRELIEGIIQKHQRP